MEKKFGNEQKVCRRGLNDIWVMGSNGSVRMCGWTNYIIGNLAEQSMEEIWHGERAEIFRESLRDGSYRFCNRSKCPHCANNEEEEFLVDYEVPEYPKYCNLSYQLQCNYACKFCRDKKYETQCGEHEKYALIEKEIRKILPHLDKLAANGAGELFCSDSILRLLAEENMKPNITIGLETNGSLFNEANWDKISNLGKYDISLAITVHSFQEDTYQYLSGTNLPVQNEIDNLKFVSKLRREGVINKFTIATVICERNFREMPAFVKRCLDEFDVDSIRLRFFEPYGVMDRLTEWFYDIRTPNHPYHEEFLKVMSDPIFDHPKVWKWQGDKASLQATSPYESEHRNVINLSEFITHEELFEKTRRYFELNGIKKIALYGGAKIGRAYQRILSEHGIRIDTIFDKFECEKKEESFQIVRPTTERINAYDLIIVTTNTYRYEIEEELERLHFVGIVHSMDQLIQNISE